MIHFNEEDLLRLYKGKRSNDHRGNFYRCIAERGLPVSDVCSHLQTMKVASAYHRSLSDSRNPMGPED
jgi:hypothetical protein